VKHACFHARFHAGRRWRRRIWERLLGCQQEAIIDGSTFCGRQAAEGEKPAKIVLSPIHWPTER
jgi:hypothetical protein